MNIKISRSKPIDFNKDFPIEPLSKLLSLWGFCLVIFIVALFFATNQFSTTIDNTDFGKSLLFGFTLFFSFVLGALMFLVVIHNLIKYLIDLFTKSSKLLLFTRRLPFLVKYLILLSILPIPLFIYIVAQLKKLIVSKAEKRNYSLKVFLLGLIFLTVLPLWVCGYFVLGVTGASKIGYIDQPISIAGTGSMYPTFPKGQTKTPQEQGDEIVATAGMFPYPNGLFIFGHRLFGHEIERGDIVLIENDEIRKRTEELFGESSGWVKRVVGVAGDNIELRDGIVYLNDQPLKEPYIAKAQSTFGEAFLSDCQKITVPPDSIFVMGDNRKGSGDSREIGFINLSGVQYVLPFNSQKGKLDQQWHDTSQDLEESSKIKLNKERYLELLNQKRQEAGAKPLKYQPKLEKSAARRGESIIKFGDFSYEASKSGYTMEKSLRDVGYSNIIENEAIIQGYYEAEELIEYLFEFPEWKKFFLEKDYQESGIEEIAGQVNGCPTQVIVQHVAGYVPPNYKKEDIESWKNVLSQLKEIQPSWQDLKNYKEFYEKNKKDVDRINEIISIRVLNINAITTRMEANQWLNQKELDYIHQDEMLYNEQAELANRLNSR